MNKKFIQAGAVVFIACLVFVSGNAYSFLQTEIFLPVIVKNFGIVSSPNPTSPSPEPTHTQTSPAPPAPSGLVEIRDIFFDPPGSEENGEYVVIENDESFPIQLLNWTLRDEANHVFTFPSFVIQPNQQCRIYTNEFHPESCGFNYGSSSPIWNNTGDTAYLRDANGTLIDDYSY